MSRWRIEGTLTTASPLHIGSGETSRERGVERRRRAVDSVGPTFVEVSTVALDVSEKPVIPATGLKGALRAWLKRHKEPAAKIAEVFGIDASFAEDGRPKGAAAQVLDGRFETMKIGHPPAGWSAARATGVATSVAIDRARHAAEDKKLFHYEFVPPGVTFRIAVEGMGSPGSNAGLVLKALRGFNDPSDRVTLGAGGPAWGWMTWAPEKTGIAILSDGDVRKWLGEQVGAPVPAYVGVGAPLSVPPGSGDRCFELLLELTFPGSFLVNDPSQTRSEEDGPSGPKRPDHAPLRDSAGKPMLPASSFRGVLRSRAEMILRTIHGDSGACREGLGSGACPPVKKRGDLARLCAACRLFGTTGWKSPLAVSEFVSSDGWRSRETTQDFLRIDRFTGSGANHLKFDGLAAVAPVLAGKLRLNLAVPIEAGLASWAIGLLALVLRDMAAGEMTAGFGAGKGYGRMRMSVTNVACPAKEVWCAFDGDASTDPQDLRGFADLGGVQPASIFGVALDRWVKAIPRRPTLKGATPAGGGQ